MLHLALLRLKFGLTVLRASLIKSLYQKLNLWNRFLRHQQPVAVFETFIMFILGHLLRRFFVGFFNQTLPLQLSILLTSMSKIVL